MNRTNKTTEYRFNEKGHVHEILIDGVWRRVTGCTTILGVIAKPALIPWAAKSVVEWIRENVQIVNGLWQVNDEQLEEAKSAHRKKKEKAGDWGTGVHASIEILIKNAITNGGMISDIHVSSEDYSIALNQFVKWAVDNKVKFLESEKGVYSKTNFMAGIVDIICEIDGNRWLADIKTGSGIYAEAFWQMGGYDIMLEEMGQPKVSGYLVLNLKKDGSFEEKRSISNDDHKKAFMAALTIYRIQEKINNNIL